MEIECRSELDPGASREWTAFLGRCERAHPRQEPRFGEIERACGFSPLYVTGRAAGELCAVGIFSLRTRRILGLSTVEAISLSGPVADDPDALAGFVRAAVAHPGFRRVSIARITPYWHDEAARALADRFAGGEWTAAPPPPLHDTGIIDLVPPEEKILGSFSESGRRKVRLAQRAGIEVRPLETRPEIDAFFRDLNRMLSSKSLTTISAAEIEVGFERIYRDPAVSVILGAFHEGRFLGGLLCYRSWHSAHGRYYFANSQTIAGIEAIRNVRIAPILWYSGMLWGRRQGCRRFDLEGWREIIEESDPLYDICHYKSQFHPAAAIRFPEHFTVLRPALHAIASAPSRARAELRRRFPGLARRWSGR